MGGKGRPKNSLNNTYFKWNVLQYDNERDRWTSNKYFSLTDFNNINGTSITADTVKRIMRRHIEYDECKKYSPKSFWNKYKHITIEKIYEKAEFEYLR